MKDNANIVFSSVGFTNPKLGFQSHHLNSSNANTINSLIGNNEKDPVNEQIPTYKIKNLHDIRDHLLDRTESIIWNHDYWNFMPILNNENSGVTYENIFHPSADILFNMNNYNYIYNKEVYTQDGFVYGKEEKDNKPKYMKFKATPSLFNPLFMVQHLCITPNTPLRNDMNTNNGKYGGIKDDISNCTIKELVKLSQTHNSILGLAKYRYVDFMYCKDLGKIANNHLITLRKFAAPIGDNIFEFHEEAAGDVGRLVTWFGTEDNKLEDILNFQYKATWKPLEAKIDEVESKENGESRGKIGTLLNSVTPQYNRLQGQGHIDGNQKNIFGFFKIDNGYTDDNRDILRNYDKNKVYEPKDTIQDTVTYEGKLQFTHSFNLTFCYKLRAYDSINPRSAFLDLIGNILQVTYRRGQFWGGSRKWIGPPQNASGWNKVNSIIDKGWHSIGGVISGLANGTLDFKDFMGTMSNWLSNGVSSITGMLSNFANDPKKYFKEGVDYCQKVGLDNAALGVLKNKLGRPALYALDSLLKGENVGLWHVTIGNPKNPIISMGNLILENTQFQQFGPLGLDDFPTELKVTVTLKHARSRDAVEISRMYTKGTSGIYFVPHNAHIEDFYMVPNPNASEGVVDPAIAQHGQEISKDLGPIIDSIS